MRRALYEAASALMTRFKGKDKVKSWGKGIAERSCHCKETVARKLAVIMRAMWTDGTSYGGDPSTDAREVAREVRMRAVAKQRKLLGVHA